MADKIFKAADKCPRAADKSQKVADKIVKRPINLASGRYNFLDPMLAAGVFIKKGS